MKKKRIIALVMSIVMLVSACLTFASCGGNLDNTPADDEQADLVETNALKTEFVNTESIQLMAASPMMMSRATNVITQRLTATVYPATASNKAVDWSVSWGEDHGEGDVSNFITVTPDAAGSPNVTVTCKAAFTGTVVITATTRQNGFEADCIVTFVGVPANIVINTNLTNQADGYHVAVDNTYQFNVELSNPFGEVGMAYRNLNVSVEGVGTIEVGYKEKYSSGGTTWLGDTKHVDLNSIKDKFVSVAMHDGAVIVTVTRSIESYNAGTTRLDSGRTVAYTDAFKSYVSNCYFKVILTEPNSGVSSSFNIVIDPNAVTGVDISDVDMFF